MHACSILHRGPQARCKAVDTQRKLGLTITKISLQTLLFAAVCHCLSPTVCHLDFVFHRNYLFYFPFLPSAPSPGLWSSLFSFSFFSWSWKLCVAFDEENGYLAKVSIAFFPFSLFLLYAAGVNVIPRTCNLFLSGISSATRKLLVEGMEVMNFSENLQIKDDRCLQHTKYASYFRCIAKCRHFWPANRK